MRAKTIGLVASAVLASAGLLGAISWARVTAPPRVIPGGVWLRPIGGETVQAPVSLAARAYPASRTAPAIANVEFTVSWEGRDGPWLIACRIEGLMHTDQYECIWDPRAAGVPPGPIHVSFDVYDMAGGVNRAPHGVRVVNGAW